jgi:myo-inositol-1(or 4)-monophosphatase
MFTIAIKAARAAGEIITSHLEAGSVEVYEKHEGETYTNCDVLCEKKIREIIGEEFPDHDFLGEECGRSGEKSEYLWIIDPIDGTNNFVAKIPFFAVCIALVVHGDLAASVMFNPITNELFTSEKGKGAFLNGARISMLETKKLEHALIGFNAGKRGEGDVFLNAFLHIQPKAKRTRVFGASALELAYVAAGKIDGFVSTHSHVWDYAAAVLLVREAGGSVLNFKGEQWDFHDSSVIAAPADLAAALLELL